MKDNQLIYSIIFTILTISLAVANAGEIYQWVDEKGVKRFSDSPTDRNVLRKNSAESYPAFVGKDPSHGSETSGFQENNSPKQSRENLTAEGNRSSVGESQNKGVYTLGHPESDDHTAGEVSRPEKTVGSYGKTPYGRSIPIVTGSAGTPSSAAEKPSRKPYELNQKSTEVERRNQQVEEYNSKVKKHNDQIQRQQYRDSRDRTYEAVQNRNKSIDNGSVSTPYLEKRYRTRR